MPGCQWVARYENEQELFDEIHSHAREAHGMDEVPPEVLDRIQDVIAEAYVPGIDSGNPPDSRNDSSASV